MHKIQPKEQRDRLLIQQSCRTLGSKEGLQGLETRHGTLNIFQESLII